MLNRIPLHTNDFIDINNSYTTAGTITRNEDLTKSGRARERGLPGPVNEAEEGAHDAIDGEGIVEGDTIDSGEKVEEGGDTSVDERRGSGGSGVSEEIGCTDVDFRDGTGSGASGASEELGTGVAGGGGGKREPTREELKKMPMAQRLGEPA